MRQLGRRSRGKTGAAKRRGEKLGRKTGAKNWGTQEGKENWGQTRDGKTGATQGGARKTGATRKTGVVNDFFLQSPILTWIVSLVIGSNGSKGGFLYIHQIHIAGNSTLSMSSFDFYWSWPLFFASAGLGFFIFKMME